MSVSVRSIPVPRLILAVTLVCTLSGCESLLQKLDELAAMADTEEPAPEPAAEPAEEKLPEKPASSTVHSETRVITFRSVLEDVEMTREERIRAFENLDPGALQKPVAPPSVSGAPPVTPITRRPKGEPTEREIAAARRKVPVVMYSTAWCGVCKRARAYFEKEQIPFQELDVDENVQARADYLLLNPRRSVPTIKIGDEVIIGFSPASVERALDAAARARL